MASNSKVSRFQIKQGKLMLGYPTLPDLGCLLMELDEHGCRGQVPFQYLDKEMAAQWRRILKPKLPLLIKLDVPPHLNGFELEGPVAEVIDMNTHTEIELAFTKITPAQQEVLAQAVLSLAMLKMRANRALPPGMTPIPVARPAPPEPQAEPAERAAAEVSDSSLVEIFPTANAATPSPIPATPVGGDPNEVPPDPQAQLHESSITMPSRPPAVLSREVLQQKKLGEVLIHMGQLSPELVQEAVTHASMMGERLGRFLLRNSIVPSDVLCRALALQSGLPVTDLTDMEITDSLAKLFPHATMAQHCFVPFDEAKTFVCIAVADPLKPNVVTDLERVCNKKIELFLAQEDQVLRVLDKMQQRIKRKPRKHQRHDVELPVMYQLCSRLGSPAEPSEYQGMTINLSEGGMLIKGPASRLGTPEDLRRRGMCCGVTIISVPGQEIRCISQIRAIRKPKDEEWLIGLEVVEMSTEDRRRYKALLIKAAHGR